MKKIIAIALAVLMLAGLATVAFAADSGMGDVKHNIKITKSLAGKMQTPKTVQVNDGETYTIVAEDVDGYTFKQMTITGEYTRSSRNSEVTTERTVTILPTGDVDVIIEYVKNGSNQTATLEPGTVPSPAAPSGPVDEGATSPDTGVNFALIVLAVAMGVCGVAVASKKVFEK